MITCGDVGGYVASSVGKACTSLLYRVVRSHQARNVYYVVTCSSGKKLRVYLVFASLACAFGPFVKM